jgi:hypothetical protein
MDLWIITVFNPVSLLTSLMNITQLMMNHLLKFISTPPLTDAETDSFSEDDHITPAERSILHNIGTASQSYMV